MYWWLIGSGGYIGYSSYYGTSGTANYSCQLCLFAPIRLYGFDFRPDILAIGFISVLLGVIGLVRASRRKRAAASAE